MAAYMFGMGRAMAAAALWGVCFICLAWAACSICFAWAPLWLKHLVHSTTSALKNVNLDVFQPLLEHDRTTFCGTMIADAVRWRLALSFE